MFIVIKCDRPLTVVYRVQMILWAYWCWDGCECEGGRYITASGQANEKAMLSQILPLAIHYIYNTPSTNTHGKTKLTHLMVNTPV